MLPPDQRSVLLDLLRPPPGFQLDRAVGTTFSIDLEAALIAPLAFASFRLSGTSDPVAVMEAVRSAADRIDLFNQAGQMHAPSRASGLFAFLEAVVHDATAPKPGHLFHPKVWFLRYVDEEGERCARLLCLSRNLTSDASWDLALRLDGTFGRTNPDNRPLQRFLAALPGLAVQPLTEARQKAIAELAASSMRVEWEIPEGMSGGPKFWPFGLAGPKVLPDFSGYRHLLVAPFLNEGGLDLLAPDPRSRVDVVSRVEDVERLPSARRGRLQDVYVVSSAADLDDPDAEDLLIERDRLSGLHAKFYVVERNRAAHLFVGSANATDAAFGGNVEMLVELTGGATKFGVDRFLDPDEGFRSILERYEPVGDAEPDPVADTLWMMRKALRALAETSLTATVAETEGGWTEHLEGDQMPVPEDMAVTAALLSVSSQDQELSRGPVDLLFGPVALDEVTPFVLVRLQATAPDGQELVRSAVLRAQLVNDPADRLDEILARQVDTPEKFLRFLLLLLGLADGTFVAGDGMAGEHGSWSVGTSSNGLFELLLRAVTDRPEVVTDLRRLVARLQATERGRAAFPKGFESLWAVVEAATPGLDALRTLTTSDR